MDGKVFPVNKMQSGTTAPPFHPWCRGTTAPYYEDMVGVGQRFARDADGKTYTVPSDMTYAEWKQKFVDNSAESGIINTYKNNGFNVAFKGEFSRDTIKKVEKATKKVEKDFTILKQYSEPIVFGVVDGGGYAITNYNSETGLTRIILNKDSFSNVEELLKSLDSHFIEGISYKTKNIESLVAHEMGHSAHIALALKRAKIMYGVPLRGEHLIRFNEEYLKIQQDIYIVAFDSETYDEIQNVCIEQLGFMTKEKPTELIAQSFGNYYYGENESSVARKIVSYFMKELN